MTQPRSPNPFLVPLGRLLEGVLERALALDAETRARLIGLDGHAVAIELVGTPLALRLSVEDERVCVGPAFAGASDLRVAATPGSLLAMAMRRSGAPAAPIGKVAISGDAELARRLEQLLGSFRPDVEEAFARTFGDVVGVPLAQAFTHAFTWGRASARALVQDTADFLREESRDLIAPAEMDEFLDAVDALRERAERLQARISRLATRVPERLA